MTSRMLPILAILLVCLASLLQARYICNPTSASDSYPYCINIPDVLPSDNCGGALPLVLSLSGSGAKGNGMDVYSRTTYDGFGLLLARHRAGNMSQVTKLAAERFITVIPMPPYTEPGNPKQNVYHYWPQNINNVLRSVRATYGTLIDWKRMHCVGYSMGARGCWRYAVANTTVLASSISIGGAAEKAGDINLQLEPTTPTFPSLNKLTRLPIRQYSGTKDTVAPLWRAQETQNELIRLGSKTSTLFSVNVDHQGLQTAPFNVDMLSWLLTQKQAYDKPCKPVLALSRAISTPAITKRAIRHRS